MIVVQDGDMPEDECICNSTVKTRALLRFDEVFEATDCLG